MSTLLEEDEATTKLRNPAPQPISVNVKSVFGNGTICDVEAGDGPSHTFVHGGIIHLHGNTEFDVTWQLQPGDPANLEFDTDDPIWSSQGQCPDTSCQDPQVEVGPCTTNTLQTTITPNNPPNAVHISLGWSNGERFDPIIINH